MVLSAHPNPAYALTEPDRVETHLLSRRRSPPLTYPGGQSAVARPRLGMCVCFVIFCNWKRGWLLLHPPSPPARDFFFCGDFGSIFFSTHTCFFSANTGFFVPTAHGFFVCTPPACYHYYICPRLLQFDVRSGRRAPSLSCALPGPDLLTKNNFSPLRRTFGCQLSQTQDARDTYPTYFWGGYPTHAKSRSVDLFDTTLRMYVE